MWLVDAVGAAIVNAAFGVEQKRRSALASPLLLAVATRLWTVPLTIFVLILLPQPWHFHGLFWRYLLIAGSLTAIGTYLTFVAYQLLDFSLAFPLLSVSPAVALLSAWVIDKTTPSPEGILGVALVAVGTYFLTSAKHQLVVPWKNLGTYAILGVAVLYAVTTSFDKLGVAASSPTVWTLAVNLVIITIQLPLCLLQTKHAKVATKRRKRRPARPITAMWLAGTLGAGVMLFQMYSLQAGGYVPYLLAIKQLSVIIAVVAGWYTLNERPSKRRFFSAALVTLGVIVVAIS